MKVTIYNKDGSYKTFFESSADSIPDWILGDGVAVDGLHGRGTRLVDGVVEAFSGAEIEQIEFENALQTLRLTRNALLVQSDWTQLPDAPVNQAAWRIYRQALRDLPNKAEDPFKPAWPTQPSI